MLKHLSDIRSGALGTRIISFPQFTVSLLTSVSVPRLWGAMRLDGFGKVRAEVRMNLRKETNHTEG